MDKVFKILVVFSLLMLIIVYSYRAREKRYRDYYLFKRATLPYTGDPDWDRLAAAGSEAGASATDLENQLDFGCGAGGTIVVTDHATGDTLATISLAEPADILVFDAATRLLYSCSVEGALTVIRQDGSDRYKIMQRLLIPKGCSGLAADPQTGRIYLAVEGSVWIYANA